MLNYKSGRQPAVHFTRPGPTQLLLSRMLQWGAAIFSELSTKWKLSACNSCKSYAACSRTDLIRVSIIDNLCSRMFKIHAGNYILTALMHSHSQGTNLKALGRVGIRDCGSGSLSHRQVQQTQKLGASKQIIIHRLWPLLHLLITVG